MWAAGGDISRRARQHKSPAPLLLECRRSIHAAAIEGWADACAATQRGISMPGASEAAGRRRWLVSRRHDFQNDALEAHRRGMRCVFIKEENEDDTNDVHVISHAAGRRHAENVYRDGLRNLFARSHCSRTSPTARQSWDEVPDVVAEWTSSATEDPSPIRLRGAGLVKAAGAGEFWPRFRGGGIQDVATLKLLTEEDLRELGLPLGCRRRLLAELTKSFVVLMRAVRRRPFSHGKSATVKSVAAGGW